MFDDKNFTNLYFNQSKTPNKFAYKTTETIATVLAADYFNEIYSILKVDDIIEVHASDASTFVKVTGNADKVVAVADGTDIA